MNYIETCFRFSSPEFAEILEAELAELPFESFEHQPNQLKAYILELDFNRDAFDEIVSSYTDYIESLDIINIEHKNWNEVWESNYPPVRLDNELFIGATFHKTPVDVQYSIILEPNMSFGTGHHPTTEMMLRALFEMNLKNKKVLDFGCGSAILSIYAGQKEAQGIGIEIDANAADAARKNLELNQIEGFSVKTGGIEKLGSQSFDVILANINRNVIEECLDTFVQVSKPSTIILCSGFLTSDVEAISSLLKASGFETTSSKRIEDWAMIAAKRP